MVKEISLTQGKVAIVDDEDFDDLNQFKWYALRDGNTFYAIRQIYPKGCKGVHYAELMHRRILGNPEKKEIDHINGNGLDNRKENLRVGSHQRNMQNLHSKKSSKYPGVFWVKRCRCWSTQISYKGKNRHLGYFKKEIDASITHEVAYAVLIEGR